MTGKKKALKTLYFTLKNVDIPGVEERYSLVTDTPCLDEIGNEESNKSGDNGGKLKVEGTTSIEEAVRESVGERKELIKAEKSIHDKIEGEEKTSNTTRTSITSKTSKRANVTKIEDLRQKRFGSSRYVFSDEMKKLHDCSLSIIDLQNPGEYRCFWDRNPFTGPGIGCPIDYISDRAIKTYYSEISKNTYIIKNDVQSGARGSREVGEVGDREEGEIEILKRGFYETDGIFCCPSCVKAFIIENKRTNKIYDRSENLLSKQLYDITGKAVKIEAAPHWRVLKEYGGTKTIEEFRESLDRTEIEFYGICKPIAHIYEENYTL